MRCCKLNLTLLIRVFLSLFTISCAGSGKKATTTAVSQTSASERPSTLPQKPPRKDEVSLSSITPWFQEIESGDAAQALTDNRLDEAVVLFDAMVQRLRDDNLRLRARFLAAYISFYAGDAKRAYAELPSMAERLPLLANVAFEVSALAACRLEKYDQCILLATHIADDNAQAALLIGDALFAQGNSNDALLQYRKVMAKWPGDTKAECQAKIVICIEALTRNFSLDNKTPPESLKETAENETTPVAQTDAAVSSDENTPVSDKNAAGLASLIKKKTAPSTPADETAYQRMLIDEALELIATMSAQSPAGKWTREACDFEDELLRRIGETVSKERKETRVAKNLFEDAHEDMLKRRHEKALKGYQKAIRFAKRGGALECRARYEEALVTSFLRQHGDAASLFSKVANDCDEPEIRLKSLYKAGKSFMSAGEHKDAIAMFAEVEKQFSTHSFADDARLHGARSYLSLGNEKKFLEMITSLPDDYPTGDMRAEALWTGALRALDAHQLSRAKDILEKYFNMFPIEKGWYTAGRAAYWYGRVMELLGEKANAMRQYEYVITTTPFTFYMVLAYSRLSALDELRAKLLAQELTPEPGEEQNNIPAALVEKGPFAEGVELIRLGLTTRGTKCIKAMLRKPKTPPSVHRAAAALFRHVGSFADSKEITVALDNGWENHYPAKEDYTAWTLAFPKAFEREVAFAANESGVDPALILAIMREESGFNSQIESWANAMGLMQLILPTARAMGKELNIGVNRKALTDPRTNIRLGANYLKNLANLFGSHPSLMIPGYNAGSGAVSRWLKDRGNQSLDLFIESIPYSQTRGYTKRVLASYATYRFLYSEGRPFTALEFKLPQ
ncbi:MAG: transglycosylase SLT domain-containing protein [Deltaproteobacteria bacterium]|nr:transglycosylase SLT domain-containing protein [Deltaproteobacteria bacterium]